MVEADELVSLFFSRESDRGRGLATCMRMACSSTRSTVRNDLPRLVYVLCRPLQDRVFGVERDGVIDVACKVKPVPTFLDRRATGVDSTNHELSLDIK